MDGIIKSFSRTITEELKIIITGSEDIQELVTQKISKMSVVGKLIWIIPDSDIETNILVTSQDANEIEFAFAGYHCSKMLENYNSVKFTTIGSYSVTNVSFLN